MRTDIDFWRPTTSGNPFREFTSLQRRMDRLFDEIFSGHSTPMDSRRHDREIDFTPSCDMEETENHYLLSMDIPGVSKEQVRLDLSGNSLTVSGEQLEERKDEKGAQRYVERFRGRFSRTFMLPDIAETEKVEAEYRDGVLRIAIPKATAAKTRRIPIADGKTGFWSKLVSRTEDKKERSAA